MRRSIGVHISHCCKWHGCKYVDPHCHVVNGEVEQECLCEDCYEDLEDEEYHREVLVRIEEIKKVKDNKKRLLKNTMRYFAVCVIKQFHLSIV